jgi:ABC-type multidrug transport system fused ATPase/permease subunit
MPFLCLTVFALQKKFGLIIAHRLKTVMAVDKIAVLNGGKLIEEGIGEELFTKNQTVCPVLPNYEQYTQS